MGGVTVNRSAAKAAANNLEPAATMAGDSAKNVAQLAGNQTASKWGTETGPDDFRAKYSEGLQDAQDDLKTMQERLTSYVTAVRSAITAFDNTDGDAAARHAIEQGQVAQEQREQQPAVTPPPPTSRINPGMA